jgi:hypothetical protein
MTLAEELRSKMRELCHCGMCPAGRHEQREASEATATIIFRRLREGATVEQLAGEMEQGL